MNDGSAEEHEVEADKQSEDSLFTVRGFATFCVPIKHIWLNSEIKEITIKLITE